MNITKAAALTKKYQDVFNPQEEPITITTDGPDPTKNLENAKEFGKAGVKGKWVHKEER